MFKILIFILVIIALVVLISRFGLYSKLPNFVKKVFEKLIEGALYLSGGITSLIVVLIVIFLFHEGLGVIGSSPIDKSYVIAVNKKNPIKNLTSAEIGHIFNRDSLYTHWDCVGGNKDTILLFTVDDLSSYVSDEEMGANLELVPQCFSKVVDSIPNILAFLPANKIPKNFTGVVVPPEKITLWSFLSGREWYPTSEPAASMGVLPLILGTLLVSFCAILIALPLGLATAVYMGEIADEKIRRIMKPIIELLAGIPSVIYGFFGLVVIVPLIQKTFDLPTGETALSGAIILAIMALPTIITISEDAMRNTPRAMKEASLALGATKWQTIYRVVIPYSSSGITAAAILGIGRAVGETMAVLMVTGNANIIPHSLLQSVHTIPATIAAELGEAPQGGLHYKALFALGCILFVITLIINLSVESISSKKKGARH